MHRDDVRYYMYIIVYIFQAFAVTAKLYRYEEVKSLNYLEVFPGDQEQNTSI